ncbi:MAG: peptide-methionine (S)-S-oxide reductase MsrA [Novosphingobium sp.]
MKRAGLGLLILTLATACQQPASAAEHAVNAPAATRPAREAPGLKTAIFAGGCFWGIEGVFSHVNGVTSTVSGYHGGDARNANYDAVSGGSTGHAESVRVTYDPTKVRYDQLLQILFSVGADPTLLNRQGPDVGTQYRAAIVPVTEEQRLVASAYLAQLRASGLWRQPIVAKLERYQRFYPAEDYHQDFMLKNPRHPYIVTWDVQKVAALRRLYPRLYRAAYTPG